VSHPPYSIRKLTCAISFRHWSRLAENSAERALGSQHDVRGWCVDSLKEEPYREDKTAIVDGVLRYRELIAPADHELEPILEREWAE
jgi:hypothetical protein